MSYILPCFTNWCIQYQAKNDPALTLALTDIDAFLLPDNPRKPYIPQNHLCSALYKTTFNVKIRDKIDGNCLSTSC